MKKLTLLLILAIPSLLHSQPCLPDGIVFTTQTEIDNFQSNFPGCTQIEGFVTIGEQWFSSDIENLDGLSVITSIDGYLEIRLNDNLVSLSGLNNISTIGGTLSAVDNDILTDLSGLGQLSEVGGNFYIGYNDALKSLAGTENLLEIGGNLEIRENDSIETLTGMESLETIGGGLEIRANAQLKEITDLNELESLSDYLMIIGNDSLASLEGLESLTTVPGNLTMNFNSSITDLSGLDNMAFVGGSLEISHNDLLEDLSGLENLTTIGDFLSLHHNASLADLSAMNNLTEIGAELRVFANDILNELAGLQNIDAASISDLYLHDNTVLSTCEIESVCNYLADPNGAIYITNNAAGCNNQEEVEAACGNATVGETTGFYELTIHPNPFSRTVAIEYHLKHPASVRITFFNPIGMKVIDVTEEQAAGINKFVWEPLDVPGGVYYFSLQAGEGSITGKVVKLH